MALRLLSILHKNFIAPVAAADLAVVAAVLPPAVAAALLKLPAAVPGYRAG